MPPGSPSQGTQKAVSGSTWGTIAVMYVLCAHVCLEGGKEGWVLLRGR